MFRSERLDFSRPALAEAASASARALGGSAGSVAGGHAPGGAVAPGLARMVFEWSLVHGFAMLLIDGRLDSIVGKNPPAQAVMALLDGVMQSTEHPPR